jgi:hypothetical protein
MHHPAGVLFLVRMAQAASPVEIPDFGLATGAAGVRPALAGRLNLRSHGGAERHVGLVLQGFAPSHYRAGGNRWLHFMARLGVSVIETACVKQLPQQHCYRFMWQRNMQVPVREINIGLHVCSNRRNNDNRSPK